jgi:hypothetical protein
MDEPTYAALLESLHHWQVMAFEGGQWESCALCRLAQAEKWKGCDPCPINGGPGGDCAAGNYGTWERHVREWHEGVIDHGCEKCLRLTSNVLWNICAAVRRELDARGGIRDARRMSETGRFRTGWAELVADCYTGPGFDEIRPEWEVFDEGGKDADRGSQLLELAARSFPPGTIVEIHEPVCPGCGETRKPRTNAPEGEPFYSGPCRCGFDWDTWVGQKYG